MVGIISTGNNQGTHTKRKPAPTLLTTNPTCTDPKSNPSFLVWMLKQIIHYMWQGCPHRSSRTARSWRKLPVINNIQVTLASHNSTHVVYVHIRLTWNACWAIFWRKNAHFLLKPIYCNWRARGSAPSYKPEGRSFDSQRCRWNFSLI